ncbi:MAG: cyd operon YbgE family protein [Lysobacteraceae bacterium]
MRIDARAQAAPEQAAPEQAASDQAAPVHLPALFAGIAIMMIGTAFPFVMTDATGRADHGIAMALLWAMAAGFVRGVGFIPRHRVWRVLFSGWACAIALTLYAVLRWSA